MESISPELKEWLTRQGVRSVKEAQEGVRNKDACPRCQVGTLVPDEDELGEVVACSKCGHVM